MEYTIKLSNSQGKELREEAALHCFEDVGEYLFEKMKTAIRLEESESIRNIMQTEVLSEQQKAKLKAFGANYLEDYSKAKVIFENEEHFIIRLKVKLKEHNI